MRWMLLPMLSGCTLQTFEVRSVQSVQFVDATRPLEGDYIIESTAVEAHACTAGVVTVSADGTAKAPDPISVFGLIQQAKGDAAGLAGVVVQRDTVEHFGRKLSGETVWGRIRKVGTDEVCYSVEGYPIWGPGGAPSPVPPAPTPAAVEPTPVPAKDQAPSSVVLCKDGSLDHTCDRCAPGCCAWHGGCAPEH